MSWWLVYVIIGLVAALFSTGFTWLVRALAPRLGFLDRPRAEAHKSHARAVPTLGGVGMFLAWLLVIGGGALVASNWPSLLPAKMGTALSGIHTVSGQLVCLCAGALGMAILGLVDDRRPLPAHIKFFFQFLIAGGVAYGGVRITLFVENPWITWGLTTFWIVFIVNATNFFDNMDALAGGMVTIAAFFFATVAAMRGQFFVAALGAATCGTALGFLVFNRPPATIFMGDAGSQFLGFCLAVLGSQTTFYAEGTPTLAPLLIPVLVLALPIFDVVAVVIIRTYHGKPFYVGDNRHISHRFEQMGLTRATAVLLVQLLNLIAGAAALTLLWLPLAGALLVFLQVAAVLTVVSLLHIYTHTG